MPAYAPFGNLNALRESAVLHFTVEGRPTEPGAVQDSFEAEDRFKFVGHGRLARAGMEACWQTWDVAQGCKRRTAVGGLWR